MQSYIKKLVRLTQVNKGLIAFANPINVSKINWQVGQIRLVEVPTWYETGISSFIVKGEHHLLSKDEIRYTVIRELPNG